MAIGFFKLPQELCDEVYHYTWPGTPVVTLCGRNENKSTSRLYRWTAWYDPHCTTNNNKINNVLASEETIRPKRPTLTKLHLWILASKQVFEESREGFHRRGIITSREAYYDGCLKLPTVLSPLHVRELHISLPLIYMADTILIAQFASKYRLRIFIQKLSESKHLRVFKLRVQYSDIWHCSPPQQLQLHDLVMPELLCLADHLIKLEVVVEYLRL